MSKTATQDFVKGKHRYEYVKHVKQFMTKELNSPSKMDTFNRLLRRVPGTALYEDFKFEIAPEDLYSRKRLFVDEIVFVKNVPWSIIFEPSSPGAHDVVIKCGYPSALWQQDFEINACIKFQAPKPISYVSQTRYFRLSQNTLILSECIPHNKVKSAKMNKNSKLDFSVSIEMKSDKRKIHKSNILPNYRTVAPVEFYVPFQYMTDYMLCPGIHPHKMPNITIAKQIASLSALANVLSEETMRLSTGEDWFKVLCFVCNGITMYLDSQNEMDNYKDFICESGIVDHFVFLMKANFAQPKWAALIPIVIMNVVRDHAGNFENTEDQVLAITQTVVDNVKNKKSGSMLVSRLLLQLIPLLYARDNMSKPSIIYKNRIIKLIDHIEYLNDFYNIKNALPLARNLGTPSIYSNLHPMIKHDMIQTADGVTERFNDFYHFMCLTFITAGKLQVLPISTSKKFLVTLGENKINPYFKAASQAFTFNNLTKLLWKHSNKELTGFWLNWLGDNACHNPLLFDLVPRDVRVEVPFTSDCGCLDYSPLDISTLMPTYFTIYTKYFETVMKPLNGRYFARNVTFSIASIENVKEKGNDYHKERQFDKAVAMYDEAIERLMIQKLGQSGCRTNKDRFTVETLLTVCRSNRVSSCLELARYHDAVVDATITLREIDGLIHGDESDCWDPIKNPEDLQMLIKREGATRFKRVKALANLKQWGPALHNVLEVLTCVAVKDQAVGHYYNCLVQYMKEYKTAQYPDICVVCCDAKYEFLTKKCRECKHPYCSVVCRKKDKPNHSKYCKHLTNLSNKYGRGK